METDTKYYDDELSEEEGQRQSEEEGQRQSQKETELEEVRAWTWNTWTLRLGNGINWAKLSNINAALIKRSNGTSYVNFSLDITSLGYRTDNSPFREGNPPSYT